MDELGAVLEAPEVIDEVVEQEGEVTPEGEGAVETPEAEAKEETHTDWRKVPPELKEFFKTPAGKAAKDAWFERNAYKEKFPEGIKQVNELTAFLDEHGGREGLTTALGELTGKAAELDGIAAKMQSGDPSLISDLVQNSPEGFAKLAPVVAQEWARVDPEGWGAAMSGVMAATIASNGVPMFLEKMSMYLEFGKVDDAVKMVSQLKDWANGFAEKAAAPRTAPTQGHPDKFAQREQELNEREERIFFNDIVREVDTSFRRPTIEKELESFFKRRPGDADTREFAIKTVLSEVAERMRNDQKYQSDLTAHTSRKDRASAIKLLKSREAAVITEIAPTVGRRIYGNPGPVKVEAKPAPTPIRPKAEAKVDPRDAVMNRIFGR